MDKTIYGVRNAAQHFKVDRDKIRWIVNTGKTHAKKEMVGAIEQWVFTEDVLKEIKELLGKKKAAGE